MHRAQSGTLLAIIAALLFALALQGCGATVASAPQPATLTAGTSLPGEPAPAFSLRDQAGATVNLQQLRGHIVILTFVDATCTTECPITAQYLDWTAHFLGRDTRDVVWLAMSVNPTNTATQVETFLQKNAVQVPLHILLGNQSKLAPLWKAYHVVVQPGPDGDVQHTLGLYVIDAHGREREWVDGGYDPRTLSADVRTLLQAGE